MNDQYSHINFVVPENACDAHLHIIDPAYPNSGTAKKNQGTLQEYQTLRKTLGFTRAVFVQSKDFGLDNTCLVESISEFGKDNARGVAVVSDQVTEKELASFYGVGIRGFRFSLWNPTNSVVTFEMMKPLAEKIAGFDMHLQLHLSPEQLVEHGGMIDSFDCKVVIDHVGRLRSQTGLNNPVFPLICRWLDQGRTWLKLSGAYLNSIQGAPYHDTIEIASAFAKYAPNRMLWGSDFPHVTEVNKPSDIELLNLLELWVPKEAERQLVLVENPKELYGFE